MTRAILLAVLLFGLFGGALPAGAADSNAPRPTAAVGTPVAAAFETVGYVSQTKMLQNMEEGLKKLGALIYVCCILAALVTVGMAGRYEMALWLLIGPPMFFFLIRPGSTPGGSEWEFGKEKDNLKVRDRMLTAASIDPGEGNAASWFFHNFNLITSDIAQQLIKLFTSGTSQRDDHFFMVRQNITRDLFASELEESELISFAVSTRALCIEPLHAAQLLARGLREPSFKNSSEYERHEKEYCKKFTDEKDQYKNVPDGSAREYVAAILKLDKKNSEVLASRTCKQLWTYLVQGVEKRAKEIVGRTITMRMPPDASDEVQKKILHDVVKKLTSSNWNKEGADGDSPPCPANTGSQLAGDAGDKEKLQRIFSAWMIRKIFSDDFRGPVLASMRGDTKTGNDQPIYGDFKTGNAAMEQVRRATIQQKASALPYEIYFIAQSLPYVQGIGLYALAVMYPFFALLVIFPGMAGSFFMWCALWVWLKSWDVGWALVMIADGMLWDLMPHNTFFRYTGGPGDMDPPNILEAAFTGDYAYNLMTYYTMLGLMIGAVPIISANAVLGSKRAVAGILMDGFKTMGSTLSTAVEHHVQTLQLTEVDRAKAEFMAAKVAGEVGKLNDQQVADRDQFAAGASTDARYQEALTSRPITKLAAIAQVLRGAQDAIKAGDLSKLKSYDDELKKLTKANDFLDAAKAGSPKSRFAATAKAFIDEAAERGETLSNSDAESKTMRYFLERLQLDKSFKANDSALKDALTAVKGLSGEDALSAEDLAILEGGVTDKAGSRDAFDGVMTKVGALVDKGVLSKNHAENLLRIAGDQNMNENLRWVANNLNSIAGGGKSSEFKRDANGYLIDPVSGKSARLSIPDKDLQALADYTHEVTITRQLGEGIEEVLLTRALTNMGIGALGAGDIGVLLGSQDVSRALSFRDNIIAHRRSENFQSQAIIDLATNYYNFEVSQTSQWKFTEMVRAGISGREEWWNCADAPYHVGPTADLIISLSSRHLNQYNLRSVGYVVRSYGDLFQGGSR